MSDAGVLVVALGVRVLLGTDDPELITRLRDAWAECLASGGDLPDVVVPVAGRNVEEALEHATQQVTERAVEQRAGELLMLHAAAVADEHGNAAVLVGPSGMGKTTVARTLGRQFGYVTDETAAVEGIARLLAYPKPLSLLTGQDHKQQQPPSALGLRPTPGELRVAAVLLLDRGGDASEAVVEDLRTVPAVAMLAEHTSYLARLASPLHRLADLAHAAGGVRRVRYTEADQLVPVVSGLLGGRR